VFWFLDPAQLEREKHVRRNIVGLLCWSLLLCIYFCFFCLLLSWLPASGEIECIY